VKPASHRNKILQYLVTGATLTPRQSQDMWDKDRLAPRIGELREQGWDIVDDRKLHGVRHSVYRLRSLNGQGLLLALPEKGRPE